MAPPLSIAPPSRRSLKSTAFAIFLLTVLPLLSSCSEEQPPPPREVIRPVKLLPISTDTQVIHRSYPCRVRAARRVDLSFQGDGPLIEILVDEGQEVKQDQVLARINPRDFETDLQNIRGQLAKAQATLRSAESEYDRIVRIRKSDPGAASEAMLVKRKEAMDEATADIISLTSQVESAQNSLNDTSLTAPFDGVISKRYVDNFQEVRAKDPIFSLDHLGKVEVIVDLPETIVARVRQNQELNIIAEFAAAPGKQYQLTPKEFSTRADATTQTYQIVLEMDRPDDITILPGMTATVKGSSAKPQDKSDQFVIPALAVVAGESGSPTVWVLDSQAMTVHARQVTTGDLVGNQDITITDGLKSGEVIAVTGVNMLREGMKVRDLAEVEGYAK